MIPWEKITKCLRDAREAEPSSSEGIAALSEGLRLFGCAQYALGPEDTFVELKTPEEIIAAVDAGRGPGARIASNIVPGGLVSTIFVGIGNLRFETAYVPDEGDLLIHRTQSLKEAHEFHSKAFMSVTAGEIPPEFARDV